MGGTKAALGTRAEPSARGYKKTRIFWGAECLGFMDYTCPLKVFREGLLREIPTAGTAMLDLTDISQSVLIHMGSHKGVL